MEKTVYKTKSSLVRFLLVLIRDLILISILFIGIFLLLNDLLIFLNNELKITDQNVYLSTKTKRNCQNKCPLVNVTGVAIDQGFFGKFFNYGTIIICTKSDSIIVKYIRDPEQFKKKLNNEIIKMKNKG